jgi:hypothetical protein
MFETTKRIGTYRKKSSTAPDLPELEPLIAILFEEYRKHVRRDLENNRRRPIGRYRDNPSRV